VLEVVWTAPVGHFSIFLAVK